MPTVHFDPFAGIITVKVDEIDFNTLCLKNADGELVQSIITNSREAKIDLKSHPSGKYKVEVNGVAAENSEVILWNKP
jgi:hypothetical protein